MRGKVKRYEEIRLDFYNEKAQYKSEIIKGFEAIVYQHEIDHLDGILFIDYLSKLKKDMIIKKLKKQKKELNKAIL